MTTKKLFSVVFSLLLCFAVNGQVRSSEKSINIQQESRELDNLLTKLSAAKRQELILEYWKLTTLAFVKNDTEAMRHLCLLEPVIIKHDTQYDMHYRAFCEVLRKNGFTIPNSTSSTSKPYGSYTPNPYSSYTPSPYGSYTPRPYGSPYGSYTRPYSSDGPVVNTTRICYSCRGSGSCGVCRGVGFNSAYGFTNDCSSCGKSGRCSSCHGKGTY